MARTIHLWNLKFLIDNLNRKPIQDILIEGSIEERQHEMLHQKNAVADAVLDGKNINSKGGVDLTVGSLIGFLQRTRT